MTHRVTFLHVANGTSTTLTIGAAGVPGALSIWADPLYDGPVPAGLTDSELLEVRQQYLVRVHDRRDTDTTAGNTDAASLNTDVTPGDTDPTPRPILDPARDMRQWRRAIERHDLYDELVLWFEHDLFDQLNLLQALTWIGAHVPPSKRVSLICIGEFPGRPDFKGLGELTPDELAPLLATRRPVDDRQHDVASRAWQAFRAPTPEALDALRHDDTTALPYLSAALRRFLEEYPWTRDGLSRTERRLLQLADGNGISLSTAFPRMHQGETAYYVDDSSLAGLATQLARCEPPLLTIDLDSGASNTTPLGVVVALTGAGRSVLAGELDRIVTCGIDRWLGGVHLSGRGALWRWDDARQRIVHSGRNAG